MVKLWRFKADAPIPEDAVFCAPSAEMAAHGRWYPASDDPLPDSDAPEADIAALPAPVRMSLALYLCERGWASRWASELTGVHDEYLSKRRTTPSKFRRRKGAPDPSIALRALANVLAGQSTSEACRAAYGVDANLFVRANNALRALGLENISRYSRFALPGTRIIEAADMATVLRFEAELHEYKARVRRAARMFPQLANDAQIALDEADFKLALVRSKKEKLRAKASKKKTAKRWP